MFLKGGFEPHRIYEVVYTSESAAGRFGTDRRPRHDFHFKYDSDSAIPCPGTIQRAIGFGISQSGRFLAPFFTTDSTR